MCLLSRRGVLLPKDKAGKYYTVYCVIRFYGESIKKRHQFSSYLIVKSVSCKQVCFHIGTVLEPSNSSISQSNALLVTKRYFNVQKYLASRLLNVFSTIAHSTRILIRHSRFERLQLWPSKDSRNSMSLFNAL